MLVLACASLTLAVLLYVFWLTPEPVRVKTRAEREYLEEKREVLYENLRDLHLEYRMGKFSDQDYQQMKARYQEELAALLHELEQQDERQLPPPGLPAEAQRAKPGRCPRCGKDNPAENRFCGTCGAELRPAEEIP